jgi:drug/metabolite transporter (DMT)-like permease
MPTPTVSALTMPVLVLASLLAFAANSVLCRLALAPGLIDPVSFTTLRIASGAVVLLGVLVLRGAFNVPDFRPASSFALFLYAIAFSVAYVTLPAASGALLLFGSVQITMIGAGLIKGERPSTQTWLGILLAVGGLVWLLAPGVQAVPLLPAGAMMLSGMAWACYSLLGARRGDPVLATAWNFVGAVPFACAASLMARSQFHVTAEGALWAVISGGLTSGLGYVVWYRVLPALPTTTAAALQVSVPVLAALAGVLLLGEPLAPRLVLAGVVVLGGIALVVRARARGG